MRGSNYVNPAMGRDYISIHASTWEAAFQQRNTWHVASISIHASTWEAAWSRVTSVPSANFNSRLYMRGSVSCQRSDRLSDISIHASTWEAAIPPFSSSDCFPLFQFTPLHERQLVATRTVGDSTLFQFTPLHERQQSVLLRHIRCWAISIHASTWEAALYGDLREAVLQFQFTPLHERQRITTTKVSM